MLTILAQNAAIVVSVAILIAICVVTNRSTGAVGDVREGVDTGPPTGLGR